MASTTFANAALARSPEPPELVCEGVKAGGVIVRSMLAIGSPSVLRVS